MTQKTLGFTWADTRYGKVHNFDKLYMFTVYLIAFYALLVNHSYVAQTAFARLLVQLTT